MSNNAKIPWNTQKPPAIHVLRLFEQFLKIRSSAEKSGSLLRFRTMLKYLVLWFCKGAGPFSTPDKWANFGLYWHIPSSLTRELYITDWRDSVRRHDLYVCCFIADLQSAITVCPPRSLTVRCQQPIFALFTYLSCRQLPSNVKVLQSHDNFIIVLYHIFLSSLILTE